MNVLILTPDAVGSTLLQRLITIYMQFCEYDKPVVNLHELTNGLVQYHNAHFNQEVLGKKDGKWGYYQSLEEIVALLDSADHYKTSRLAHYHIRNRQDPLNQQIPFYQYLNDNFYIISCRRHNIFEHAISWCLSKITKKLNVYTAEEKVDSFLDLYKNGIDVDPNSLLQTLEAYKSYDEWCNNHFNVSNYFYYEEHLPHIEKYILSLPIFPKQTPKLTWNDHFDMSFQDWNKCHRMSSDIGTLALAAPEKFAQLSYESVDRTATQTTQFLLSYHAVADESWPKISTMEDYYNLPLWIQQEVEQQHQLKPVPKNYQVTVPTVLNLLPAEHQSFYAQHEVAYQQSMTQIQTLVDSGVIVTPPPIKKQTLAEKKHMVRNYRYLLNVYNQWIVNNPKLGRPIDESTLDEFAQIELSKWSPVSESTELVVGKTAD